MGTYIVDSGAEHEPQLSEANLRLSKVIVRTCLLVTGLSAWTGQFPGDYNQSTHPSLRLSDETDLARNKERTASVSDDKVNQRECNNSIGYRKVHRIHVQYLYTACNSNVKGGGDDGIQLAAVSQAGLKSPPPRDVPVSRMVRISSNATYVPTASLPDAVASHPKQSSKEPTRVGLRRRR